MKGAGIPAAILLVLRLAAALAAGAFAIAAFFYYGRLYPADSPIEDPIFYPLSVINAAGIAWGTWYLIGVVVRQWTAAAGDPYRESGVGDHGRSPSARIPTKR
jgi:hypothetical protein